MAPTTFRKALGAVKDQTTIGLVRVSSSTIAPDLDVAIVKATSHDDDPAQERHVREILVLTSYSRAYVSSAVASISRRLSRTRDWVVALKALVLLHRLLSDGDSSFHHEVLHATRRGARLLNMSDFRDEAHSNSWDLSAFVRTYALYLDQRLECALYETKLRGGGTCNSSGGGGNPAVGRRRSFDYDRENVPYGSYGNGSTGRRYSHSPPPGRYGESKKNEEEKKPTTPLVDMEPEKLLGRMRQLQQLLDRFLAFRPTGRAKSTRLVLVALYPVVRESFQIYADVCEMLAVILDRFFDMEYPDSVKAFESYASAAKQIDELVAFYGWCKDIGVARSSEYPEVQRITDNLLETLEEFIRDKARRPKSPETEVEVVATLAAPEEEEEPVLDMNEIKALPAPEGYEDNLSEKNSEADKKPEQLTGDLLDLRDETITADDQGNRLALALFSAPGNGSWGAFSSSADGTEVTSAWQTPAAEKGKADWELALVETASNLSKQKATLAGGFDPVLLNGMYDQGAVTQHVNMQISGGSASSVSLPGPGRSTATPVLALPAPDGTVQTIGKDPFAASLSVSPPSYVQMADIEKKQQLLVQEQQLWQQYARDGMQGQASLVKLSTGYNHFAPAMPYGMPTLNGGGYYNVAPY